MSDVLLRSLFKDIAKYQNENELYPWNKKKNVLTTIKKMKAKLLWHKKEEADTLEALRLFDALHGDQNMKFESMELPTDENEIRHFKVNMNKLLDKVEQLMWARSLSMKWWIDATDQLMKHALFHQTERANRRTTLMRLKNERLSAMRLAKNSEDERRRSKLTPPSEKRGKFKRRKAYQSVHGVPTWPIGHKKGSSMTRVGLELHALRDLQELGVTQQNEELMELLNALYEKMYELWETLKTRKLAREARALIKHKCESLYPATIQSQYGCPWAVNEMLEVQSQRLAENKQFNQIRNLRECVHINSPRMRLDQEDIAVEMIQLQRIADSMAKAAIQREIKHQKASDIMRKSFQRGLKLKQNLQSKLTQLEMQLEYDDGIIKELEKEISQMLVEINKHNLNLDESNLPQFEMFVPCM